MYFQLLGQMKKELGQLDKWLDQTKTYAQSKSFDPNVLVTFRLAPDQFPFSRQIQSACDAPKLAASRLTGKEPPKNDDSEKTIDELQARVRATIANLETYSEKDFAGAGTKTITTPRWEGRTMTGHDYFLEHALPNFFFHLTHAYAILRHNGVPLGKRDYLGTLTQK